MDNEVLIKQLFQRGNMIKNYLVRIGASLPDAEEIVQDTLLKGMSYVDSIDPAKFTAWLFKVATNKYYDLYRKHARRGESVTLEFVTLVDEKSPEDYYLRKEKGNQVRAVLDQLSHKYKQMLILKYEMGLTYEEIGRLMSVKPERVKTDLYRARNIFKNIYKGEEANEKQ